MRDPLTVAFEKYLHIAKELLLSCIKIKQVDSTIQMLEKGEDTTESLVADKDFRDIRVGISRATYYIDKVKQMEEVEVSLIKEARAELDPICDYMKEKMSRKE